MGILGNTASICHFRVEGEPPAGDLAAWAGECLARHGFRSIEETSDELSIGWVHLDDPREAEFDSDRSYRRDHYLTFSLRRDQRRLPAALLKAHVKNEEGKFLEANPGLRRVPKRKREEIKDAVRGMLMTKTLPVPGTWDAVWDTRRGIVTFAAIGTKAIELFDAHFRKSFEGLRLVTVHPFSRAASLLEGEELESLGRANKASSESVLALIVENRWIGEEFLLWLLYRSLNGLSEYRVAVDGPGKEGEPFVAYLDDRLVLQRNDDGAAQKVTVVGPQDRFAEVRAAVAAGKWIAEAAVYLEKDEHTWKTTLKGETFTFGSFRSPKVKMERDAVTDEAEERESVFFERMYVLETGLQLFDSLYRSFLSLRLSPAGADEEKRIGEWLSA
jgi:hypothetical protein